MIIQWQLMPISASFGAHQGPYKDARRSETTETNGCLQAARKDANGCQHLIKQLQTSGRTLETNTDNYRHLKYNKVPHYLKRGDREKEFVLVGESHPVNIESSCMEWNALKRPWCEGTGQLIPN